MEPAFIGRASQLRAMIDSIKALGMPVEDIKVIGVDWTWQDGPRRRESPSVQSKRHRRKRR